MQRSRPFNALLLIPLGLLFLQNTAAVEYKLEILGWVEKIKVPELDLSLDAKLDTGAETSSFDAEIIKKFKREGKRWVRFRFVDRNSGEEYIIVRERIRTINVIQHDGAGQSRPVVEMKLCIAGRELQTEVSLIDRGEFQYQLLIGRRALERFALIDSASTYLSEPDCENSLSEVSSIHE
jgi:hypothetical protein